MGSGEDLPIAEVAHLVAQVVGFKGEIGYDRTKPDGTPRKLMAADKLKALGWRPRVGVAGGLAATYQWYLEHAAGE